MKSIFPIGATFVAALVTVPLAVSSQDVGVSVNGTTLVFDQAPIERGGRIYVPLRGLFERLGASVVFDAGHIAMTAGPHTIGLRVGESSATIDGQPQALDAPPFVVTDRTFVPLRFVAQALGASVAYDSTARMVSVNAAPLVAASATMVPAGSSPDATSAPVGAPTVAAPVPATPPAPGETPLALRLLRVEPAPTAAIARKRPELSATFAETVDPTTVHVVLDGRDLRQQTLVTPRGFVAEPAFDLAPGPHGVTVTGRTPESEAFEQRWSFTTIDAPNPNYVSGLEPVSGTTLGGSLPGATAFDVSGFTRPKSRVRIVATTSATSPAFNDVSDSSQTVDAVASAKGYFEAPLLLADHGAGLVDVQVTSTAPGGGVAVRTLRLRR